LIAQLLQATPERRALDLDLGGATAVGKPAHEVHLGRALLETAIAFGLNVAWYWWDRDTNTPDWELEWDAASWRRKVLTFDAVRFDTNPFSVNAGSHPAAGTVVYLIGRGNGLGVPGSVALTTAESIAWEYLAEFHEKPSLNDLLDNSLGGMAIGETFYQLSEFFARGEDNGANATVSTLFSPMSNFGDWSDYHGHPRAATTDRLGFPADVSHAFEAYGGFAASRWSGSRRSEALVGVSTEINNVSGYARPVVRSSGFGPGRITRLRAGLAESGGDVTAALFSTWVALAGWHRQAMQLDEQGRVVGTSLLLTLGNSFEYGQRRMPDYPLDQVADFGVLAPGAELLHSGGDWQVRLRAQAAGSFGFVTALANEHYQRLFGADGLKSVLTLHGYYYAYGLAAWSQLSFWYRSWAFGIDGAWRGHGSIDDFDRYQERVTRNYHLTDTRSDFASWVALRPKRGYGEIGLAFERIGRSGTMADVVEATWEHRATVSFGVAF
jgi:hypothetical protein